MKKTTLSLLLLCTSSLLSNQPQLVYLLCGHQPITQAIKHQVWQYVQQELTQHNLKLIPGPINNPDWNNIAYILDVTENGYLNVNAIMSYPPNKYILVIMEPAVVCPHLYDKKLAKHVAKVFTWDDDLVDNKKYFKIHNPVYNPDLNKIDPLVPFEQKKLCCLINNNKFSSHPSELYSARRNIIRFFEQNHPDDFDLYGHSGWNKQLFPSYRGNASMNKLVYQRLYKFSITYENMQNVRGYVTEKMLNCMQAGCVPVYWGADNVTDYVPADCFIDRKQFLNDEELYQYLKNMPEETYNGYIDRIKKYLYTPAALEFTFENYAKEIIANILA